MAVSVDSLESEMQKLNSGEVRVSVSQLKQKLGVGAGVRLVIEPDATEPTLETSPPPVPTSQPTPKLSLVGREQPLDVAAPLPPPIAANNVFMKRKIKVRDNSKLAFLFLSLTQGEGLGELLNLNRGAEDFERRAAASVGKREGGNSGRSSRDQVRL